MRKFLKFTTTAALVLSSSLVLANTVTVVTSFPRDMTDPFKEAFEAAYPGTTLEVVSRNTNAAVTHLKETRDANTIDLMWASAPDAFEVLREEGLLEKIDIASEGIPDEIGGYPINDKENSYFGFAASGDRKSTRLNSSHVAISYAVFCLKKKNKHKKKTTTDVKKHDSQSSQ